MWVLPARLLQVKMGRRLLGASNTIVGVAVQGNRVVEAGGRGEGDVW